MITVQCYAVTCIIYNGLWGRKSKLACAFGPHLLCELMSRKWNKWSKKNANVPASFMWPLPAITLSVPTVNCLYKVRKSLSCFSVFLFCFNFSQNIWFAHLGDAKHGDTQPPHTHCSCEVIHIWSSLLLLVITHHYYKQVLSWLAALKLPCKDA